MQQIMDFAALPPHQIPVIVNETLRNSDVTKRLQVERFKVRVSVSTFRDSVILPRSGIAFLVVRLESDSSLAELYRSIDKMLQLHRNTCLMYLGSDQENDQITTLSAIKKRYLKSSLCTMAVGNSAECVSAIKTIAHITCKPNSDTIWNKLSRNLRCLTDRTVIIRTLKSTGIDQTVSGYLLDNLGSIRQIAAAERHQLIEASCYDVDSANVVTSFFRNC